MMRPKLISPKGRGGYGSRRPVRRSLGPKSGPAKRFGVGLLTTPRARPLFRPGHTSSLDHLTQRGNIKVVVRVRPFSERENQLTPVVQVVDEQLIVFDPKESQLDFYFHGVKQKCGNQLKRPNRDAKFVFDHVYDETASNDYIYEQTIKPTIDTILAGYNCSVFAYGATGSGKTYTMLGSPTIPGLTFLTVMELYKRLGEMKDYVTEISASYLEVYNEMVRDLLGGSKEPLNVCEDAHGINIKDLSSHKPETGNELLEMLELGNKERTQHPTDHNSESSRSHAIFQVIVSLRSKFTDLNNNYRSAKLVMVDLAGSEKGAATGGKGMRFREGANINKSLLALGNCINALADGKKHIPYRDSKLTRILKDALGGNCKTVMVANVSPAMTQYDDTYNTLRYADRAKSIRVAAKKNLLTVHARIAQYGVIVEEMQAKIVSLTAELAEARAAAEAQTDQSVPVPVQEAPPPAEGPMEVEEGESGPSPEVIMTAESLIRDMERLGRSYWETNGALRETEWRLKARETRLQSLKLVEFQDPSCLKGIDRMQKQVETFRSRLSLLEEKSRRLEREQGKCQARLAGLEITNLPQAIRDTLFKAELVRLGLCERLHENEATHVLDELLRTEGLLGQAVRLLRPLLQINRHHGHTTEEQEKAYTKVMGELVGSKLQWAEDSNGRTSFSRLPDSESRPQLSDSFPRPAIARLKESRLSDSFSRPSASSTLIPDPKETCSRPNDSLNKNLTFNLSHLTISPPPSPLSQPKH